jgi:Myb-like DNA-binding domain
MERVSLPPPMLWQQQQQQQQQQQFFYYQAALAFQQQQWHLQMQHRMWHARAPPSYAPQARASITELEDSSSEDQTDVEFERCSRASSDQSCCADDNDEELPAAAAAAVVVCVAAAHPAPIAPPAVGKLPVTQAVCWPYGHFASLAGFHELTRQQAVLQQQRAYSNAPRPVLVQQPQHQQQQQQPSSVTNAVQVCERTATPSTGTTVAASEADEVLSNTSTSSSNNKRCERWSQDEHEQFIRALELHGRDWKLIKATLPTRTLTQVT